MKIDFKVNSQGKIELDNGHILDSQILQFYDHDTLANGTGWVDLPQGLIDGTDVFEGTTKKRLPKMDEKGNINEVRLGHPGFRYSNLETPSEPNGFAGDPTSTPGEFSIPRKRISYEDQLNVQQQKSFRDAYLDQAFNSMQTESLADMFEKMGKILRSRGVSTVFTVTHPVEQKERVLYSLGFIKRTQNRYYHSILGTDSEENWLRFDPMIDNVSQVTDMLFRSGFVKGQFKVRMDIKAALDIR